MMKNLPDLSMPEYGRFLLDIVEDIKGEVKKFFYQVMLSPFNCPKCKGYLEMAGTGISRCIQCGNEIDPTVEFQACTLCGGKLIKRTYHYHCSECGTVAASRFLFDERIFDKTPVYFCNLLKTEVKYECFHYKPMTYKLVR